MPADNPHRRFRQGGWKMPVRPLQERATTAMQALEHGMEPPGASDKWRVAQLFYDTVPRSHAKVQRIERLLEPKDFEAFMAQHQGGESACHCGIAFSEASSPRRQSSLVSDASVVVKELMDQMAEDDAPMAVSLCVDACWPQDKSPCRHLSRNRSIMRLSYRNHVRL